MYSSHRMDSKYIQLIRFKGHFLAMASEPTDRAQNYLSVLRISDSEYTVLW